MKKSWTFCLVFVRINLPGFCRPFGWLPETVNHAGREAAVDSHFISDETCARSASSYALAEPVTTRGERIKSNPPRKNLPLSQLRPSLTAGPCARIAELVSPLGDRQPRRRRGRPPTSIATLRHTQVIAAGLLARV